MRRWEIVAGLLESEGARSFAEIGTKEGRLTAYVLEHCPKVEVVWACDPWMKQDLAATPDAETYEDWDFAAIRAEFEERTRPWASRLKFFQETGQELAARIERESLDCVFIDARHDYDSVHQDIATWYPLVRPGGWITGHDFNHRWPGVQRAVARHFSLMDVGVMEDSVWMYRKPTP
jgi:predicted O-methyltransferase YrrM